MCDKKMVVAFVLHRQAWRLRAGGHRAGMSRQLVRLRWLAIVAPVAFLTFVAYILRGPAHEQLHSYPGFVYVLLVLAAGVAAFSFAIFALISRLENEVLQRNQQLEAMLAVGRAASSSLGLADMLDSSLDAILGLTHAGAAQVWLVVNDELVLERQRGLDAHDLRGPTHIRLGEGFLGEAARSRRSLFVPDVDAQPHLERPPLAELGFRSVCAFPLTQRGQTLGVLVVADRDPTALSRDIERRLLEGIAEQVAVAIENARLHGRVLDGAVLEERERLAHELHDGLAQTLGYVNTQTLAIKKLLASGKGEEAEVEVAEMETTARQVYTDVREAILGLRTSSDGLLESVRSYVTRFERLTEIGVRLEVDESVETLTLPASTEIQLVRIIQEALGNVRKHARAAAARVAIAAADGELEVEVDDDGRGFDVERRHRTGWPHFGLQTMRERAEAIGGRLELVSAPGEGTRVLVRVPLEHAQAASHARIAR